MGQEQDPIDLNDAPDEQELALASALSLDAIAQREPKRALEIVQNRIMALQQIRRASIASTSGNDWTLNSNPEGQVAATLRRSGAEKIRKFWGISVYPCGDVSIRKEEKVTVAEIYGDAHCGLTNERSTGLRGYRTSTEPFIGRDGTRGTPNVGDEDLKQAARTSLETKAVRILAGMSAVSVEDLADAWGCDEEAVTARCYRGHGFGSSKDRRECGSQRGGPRSGDDPCNWAADGKRMFAVCCTRAELVGVSKDDILLYATRAIGVEPGRTFKATVPMMKFSQVAAFIRAAEEYSPRPDADPNDGADSGESY
ncbi:MAG: hypothetical protein ABIE42_11725 [Candidatus Eisenbacteria bacterium]